MTGRIIEQATAPVNEERNQEKLLPYDSPVLIEISTPGGVVRGKSGFDDGGTGEEEYED